jgi:hypothetical protein
MISRMGVVQHSQQVKNVAQQYAQAQDALEALPPLHRHAAVTLAEKLRSISASLADAADSGAKTAAMLHRIANNQVSRIAVKLEEDPSADPMDSQSELQAAAGLTRIGNDAAKLGIDLLNANRETVKASQAEDETGHVIAKIERTFIKPQGLQG